MNLLPPTKVFTQTKERDFDDVNVKDPLLLCGMKVVTVTKRHPSTGVDGNCFVNLAVFVTCCYRKVLTQVSSWLIQSSAQTLC